MKALVSACVGAALLQAGSPALASAQGFGLPAQARIELVMEQGRIAGHEVRIHQFTVPMPWAEVRARVLAYWRERPEALVHAPLAGPDSPWHLVSIQLGTRMLTVQMQGAGMQQTRGLVSVWDTVANPSVCQALAWPEGFATGRCIEQLQGDMRLVTEHLSSQYDLPHAWEVLGRFLRSQGFEPAPGQWQPVGSLRHLRWTKGTREVLITANAAAHGSAAVVISRERQ